MMQVMNEIWKQYKDTNYEVSNLGNVRNTKTNRMLKPCKTLKGYLRVYLSINKKQKWIFIHRLVAEAFIQNPLNLLYVNHKDENKVNNFCGTPENKYTDGNLEWCTHEYNNSYGTRNERIGKARIGIYNTKNSKTVLQLRKDGSLVCVWPSVHEIKRQLHFSPSNISKCCRGKLHTAFGFKWCYAKQ